MTQDVATKQDIIRLEKSIKASNAELRGEISASNAELREEIKASNAELRSEMRESFDDVVGLIHSFIDQVDARFQRMEAAFLELREEQRKIREEISKVFEYLDEVIKRQEISEQERLVMGHQLDRLDRWTHELAKKIGHKLTA